MKFSLVAVLAAASVAYAAIDLSAYPACSLTCLAQGVAASGCALDDLSCQCTTGLAKITEVATPCVIANCPQADALKVQAVSSSMCATLQSSPTSSKGAAAASGTPASSSPAAAKSSSAAAPLVQPLGGALFLGVLGALAL